MKIILTPVKSAEFEELFAAVKQGIYPFVKSVFGWSDQFQRERLSNDYKPQWFNWIYSDGNKVGVLCYKPYSNAYHVHLLIIFPEYQRKGLGKSAMNYVRAIAEKEDKTRITLSSFASNAAAISLYQSLGYKEIDREDAFLCLALSISAQQSS